MIKVYICTAPSNNLMGGDASYAHAVTTTLNENTDWQIEAQHIGAPNLTEKDIIQQVLAMKERTSNVVFQLMINGDCSSRITTGGTVTPEGLHQLSKAGVSVVVTCIEYGKKAISGEPKVVENWDKYFRAASSIVFVDEYDKLKGLEKSEVVVDHNKKGKVSVIGIPATLKYVRFNMLPPTEHREVNFICFGIIRPYKGILEVALPFAAKLKRLNSKRKVLIVGSVLDDMPHPELLAGMFKQAYGKDTVTLKKIEDIMKAKWLKQSSDSVNNLMKLYNTELKEREPDINVEFHFNVEQEDLDKLFSRCRYSLNFNTKGVSPHFSGVTNGLMASMKIYGFHLPMTPKYFHSNGFFNQLAMVFEKDDREKSLDKIFDSMLEDCKHMEGNPHRYIKFRELFKDFNRQHPIDINTISSAFSQLFHGCCSPHSHCDSRMKP